MKQVKTITEKPQDTKAVLQRICDIISDKKGEEILLLDVSDIASFTSYLLICEGRNLRQNQAIADAVVERLKKEYGLRPSHIEGKGDAKWILLDYLEFVIHIFKPETRDFYSIDKLWGDGTRLEVSA
ncbi:MAG TPA: ribosome silencing factor [Acidobacteriota bacterium]|nr:ribosome silencing factor [Acidobacteriota bacterium]